MGNIRERLNLNKNLKVTPRISDRNLRILVDFEQGTKGNTYDFCSKHKDLMDFEQ